MNAVDAIRIAAARVQDMVDAYIAAMQANDDSDDAHDRCVVALDDYRRAVRRLHYAIRNTTLE